DQQEALRKAAADGILEHVRRDASDLQQLRRNQAPKKMDAEVLEAEIARTQTSLARLVKQSDSWKTDRGNLQRLIAAWQQVLDASTSDDSPERQQGKATLMKELKQQVTSGDREEELRQIDRRMLEEHLKRVKRQTNDAPSPPPV